MADQDIAEGIERDRWPQSSESAPGIEAQDGVTADRIGPDRPVR
jgi:hypothetical protein